jgi:Flp pilus assembly protein TadG
MMRNNHGAALVEFAIIFPVLMLVIIGGLDLGLAILDKMQLEFASEASARCQAIGNASCTSPADTAAYAASLVAALPGISAANFLPSSAPCGSLVTAYYNYTPMFLPSVISLAASACYPLARTSGGAT